MAIKKLMMVASCMSCLALTTLALLVSAGTMKAQEPTSQDQIEAAANTPLLISYQGRLSDASGPITATVSMTFTIWNAATPGGSVLWRETNKPVSVSNGFFNTLLGDATPFDSNTFDGRDVWLGVQVEGDAEMTPRQRIVSVPYAFTANTLVSGALISGTQSTQVLEVRNSSAYTQSRAVSGIASATSGRTIGVWGQTDSNPGAAPEDWAMGVAGYASSTSGHTFGVWGGNESSSQHAVGVLGNSFATTGQVWGVQGIIHSTTAGAAAVNGWVDATSGQTYAVMGENPSASDGAAGVAGFSYADSGETYGVYGRSDSPDGWAGYFAGPVRITGKLTVDGATDPIIGEMYKVAPSQKYALGDVLVIDPESDTYRLCDTPNDTRVAGVVWEDAAPDERGEVMAIILGARTPTREVYVKADADYGPIRRGDLLTTSPTPGHAMRAEPVDVGGVEIYRPGTILGKALESLENGRGLIQVFVVLQ